MKKLLIILIVIILAIFIFPKPYTSSPGFVPKEAFDEFQKTKKNCIGVSFLTNRTATQADAPGKSLCFGWLE